GRVCVNPRTGKGVSGETYRFYVRTQGAPAPVQIPHPITGRMTTARDEQGRELFDLDAVEAWNKTRPGPGARKGRPLHWTWQREEILTAARDGLLQLVDGRPEHTGMELTPRQVQRISELVEAGLLSRPDSPHGQFSLTDAGAEWLAEKETDSRR